jgi:hypothetical protein
VNSIKEEMSSIEECRRQFGQIVARYNAETETLRFYNKAYEVLFLGLAVGANIMIGYGEAWEFFAAYAKVKSVKADQNGVDVELTTDGMNIKGEYARKHIKEQFDKMKSGGVKVYVFPQSDDVNVIRPNFIEWVIIGGIIWRALRVEVEVEVDNIRMKAKEVRQRVMTYNNATDTFSSTSIKKYFSMLNEFGARLSVLTKDGNEMKFRVEVLNEDRGWSLKVNEREMGKTTRDIIKRGGTDYSYYVGTFLSSASGTPLLKFPVWRW